MAQRIGLMRRIGASIKAAGFVFQGYGGSSGNGGFRYLLPGTSYDHERQAADTWKNSSVAACLSWIKKNFPEPTLQVTRYRGKGHREPLDDHALVRLIDRPNPHDDRFTLWKPTVTSLCVDGNAYWCKVRSAAGRVVQLWWLPHWLVAPCWPEDGSAFITHYAYKVNGGEVALRVEDVVHFKDGKDLRNERLGMSDLKAACREIVGDNEALSFQVALLKNMGVPGVAIVPTDVRETGWLTKDQAKELKQLYRENFTGDNRGDVFVPTGPVRIEKVGLSPEELALEKFFHLFESRICSILGVPAQVIGLMSGESAKTYNNIQEARKQAYLDCLIPMQKAVAETLYNQLLPEFGDPGREKVSWDYSAIDCLQDEARIRLLRAEKAFTSMIASRDEARSMIGLAPVPDADVIAVPKAMTLVRIDALDDFMELQFSAMEPEPDPGAAAPDEQDDDAGDATSKAIDEALGVLGAANGDDLEGVGEELVGQGSA